MNHPENMSDQGKRLIHYFKHADRFLFGLKDLGQRDMYKWLEKKGFVDEGSRRYSRSYKEVEDAMVENQGIKRIIEELVMPLAAEGFGENSINYLKGYWQKGKLPEYDDLIKNTINYKTHKYGGCSFLEMRTIESGTQVDRWTDWAKMYFVELDNLTLKSEQLNASHSDRSMDSTDAGESKSNATRNLLNILERIPYNSNSDKDQQMIDKIAVLTSLSLSTETKPIYDQLSKIIDFGQLLALAKVKRENSQIGEFKNE